MSRNIALLVSSCLILLIAAGCGGGGASDGSVADADGASDADGGGTSDGSVADADGASDADGGDTSDGSELDADGASDASDGGGDASVTEADIQRCAGGDSCVVVVYDHCCGSTRRAINQQYEAAYAAHPEWQSYYGDDCAVIGACAPDEHLNNALCNVDSGLCELTE